MARLYLWRNIFQIPEKAYTYVHGWRLTITRHVIIFNLFITGRQFNSENTAIERKIKKKNAEIVCPLFFN